MCRAWLCKNYRSLLQKSPIKETIFCNNSFHIGTLHNHTPPYLLGLFITHKRIFSHTLHTLSLTHTLARARAHAHTRTHTHARTHACSLQQGGSGALVTSCDHVASIRSPFTSPPESPSKSAKVSTRIHMCVRVYMYVCLHIYVDIRGYI